MHVISIFSTSLIICTFTCKKQSNHLFNTHRSHTKVQDKKVCLQKIKAIIFNKSSHYFSHDIK